MPHSNAIGIRSRSNYHFTDEDYDNLVKGGNNVLGNPRYYPVLDYREDEKGYQDRLAKVTYRNHSKTVLSNYEAYTISDDSVMRDDFEGQFSIEAKVRQIFQDTNKFGRLYALGLQNIIILIREKQVEFKEGHIIIKIGRWTYDILNADDPNTIELQVFTGKTLVATDTGFDIKQFQEFFFNEDRTSLLADVAPQSVEINNLRSISVTQAYKTVKDYLYGPAETNNDGEIDNPDAIHKSNFLNTADGGQTPGILQYSPIPMQAVEKLVLDRTLQLATEVNLREEFATDLTGADAQSGIAKQISRASLTATVNLMASILEKTFNKIQIIRFERFGVGFKTEEQTIMKDDIESVIPSTIIPNLVSIEAKVFQDQINIQTIEVYAKMLNLLPLDLASKAIQGLVVLQMPIPEEKQEELIEEINKSGGPLRNNNLTNLADFAI